MSRLIKTFIYLVFHSFDYERTVIPETRGH